MTQRITLHGGPAHGETVALEKDVNVLEVHGVCMNQTDTGEFKRNEEIPVKTGQYSRVGSTSDFEWDGWDTK